MIQGITYLVCGFKGTFIFLTVFQVSLHLQAVSFADSHNTYFLKNKVTVYCHGTSLNLLFILL